MSEALFVVENPLTFYVMLSVAGAIGGLVLIFRPRRWLPRQRRRQNALIGGALIVFGAWSVYHAKYGVKVFDDRIVVTWRRSSGLLRDSRTTYPVSDIRSYSTGEFIVAYAGRRGTNLYQVRGIQLHFTDGRMTTLTADMSNFQQLEQWIDRKGIRQGK